jgi:HSP20 family protein
MNIKQYAPWNWFQHETNETKAQQKVPVRFATERASHGYPLIQLHREMDRLFDEAFSGFPSVFGSFPEWPELTPIMLTPELDIKETDKSYVLCLEVPGVAKEDVAIRVDGDTLTIRGEKKQEKKEDNENYHCVERHYGSFERMLTIPKDVNADNIDASFKDGVLTVAIKRQAKSLPKEAKEIEVKAA